MDRGFQSTRRSSCRWRLLSLNMAHQHACACCFNAWGLSDPFATLFVYCCLMANLSLPGQEPERVVSLTGRSPPCTGARGPAVAARCHGTPGCRPPEQRHADSQADAAHHRARTRPRCPCRSRRPLPSTRILDAAAGRAYRVARPTFSDTARAAVGGFFFFFIFLKNKNFKNIYPF